MIEVTTKKRFLTEKGSDSIFFSDVQGCKNPFTYGSFHYVL